MPDNTDGRCKDDWSAEGMDNVGSVVRVSNVADMGWLNNAGGINDCNGADSKENVDSVEDVGADNTDSAGSGRAVGVGITCYQQHGIIRGTANTHSAVVVCYQQAAFQLRCLLIE